MSRSQFPPSQNSSSSERDRHLAERELQARLAYAELITPPHQRDHQLRARHDHTLVLAPSAHSPHGLPASSASWMSSNNASPYEAHQEQVQAYHPSIEQRRVHPAPNSPNAGSPLLDTAQAIAEDKRRRNTEASARFRSKKKERLESMEQTMTQLQQRAENLEKEAGELRRENGWLREMVILKGRRRLSTMERDNEGNKEGADAQEGEDSSE